MGEEMRGVEGDTGWRKAIPEERDRLQSRVLVGVVGMSAGSGDCSAFCDRFTRMGRAERS